MHLRSNSAEANKHACTSAVIVIGFGFHRNRDFIDFSAVSRRKVNRLVVFTVSHQPLTPHLFVSDRGDQLDDYDLVQ